MRIVFAGTPEFAVPALRGLLRSRHTVIGVYTQPDRPAGRGRRLTASPVKALALEHGVPVHQPTTLRAQAEERTLAELAPDVLVVAAYGLILPQAVLDVPRNGAINIHASLLPRWRGAAPIQRAILAGDQTSGISIMQMEAGLDTGPVLLARAEPIAPDDTSESLQARLADLGRAALLDALEPVEAGTAVAEPQDEATATYAAKITKDEACLAWARPATELARHVRAFIPWPVAYTHWQGQPVRIWQARVAPCTPAARPGTVVSASADGILVATGEEGLLVQRLQLPGGRALSAAEVINAHRLQGVVFGAAP